MDARVPSAAHADLDALGAEIRAHSGCGFEPCETATHMVPGHGDPAARVMVVGEAPGASEDRAGEPFVGRAGRLLDEVLEQAGLPRPTVWVTNVVKARPPGNRDPRPDEVEHCRPWLLAELELLHPWLVVPLGRHALGHFAPGAKITQVAGTRLMSPGGLDLFPLLHPAAALRSPPMRERLFADADGLRAVIAELAAERPRPDPDERS